MSIQRVIPTLILLMGFPAALAAQGADEQIQAALQQATQSGIPTSLLESKVAEGRAKGLPMDRIASAVERRLDGLSRAQRALGDVTGVSPGDLDVSADALESGVSEAVLTQLAGNAPRERRATAIAALTYLVGADVLAEEALHQVEEALERGPEALMNLPAQIQGPGLVEIPVEPPTPGGSPLEGRQDNTGVPSSGLPGGPPGE